MSGTVFKTVRGFVRGLVGSIPTHSRHAMLELPYPVILASASPRRRELLASLVSSFEVLPADLDEDSLTNPDPWQTARDLASAKSEKIALVRPDALVIGGDTVVAVPMKGGYEQLGKPANNLETERMLSILSGIQHLVITGVCLRWPGGERSFEVTSGVKFRMLTDAEVKTYAATGESLDKAGGYAAQGKGAYLIETVEGSLTNVIGLPMEKLKEELEALIPVEVG